MTDDRQKLGSHELILARTSQSLSLTHCGKAIWDQTTRILTKALAIHWWLYNEKKCVQNPWYKFHRPWWMRRWPPIHWLLPFPHGPSYHKEKNWINLLMVSNPLSCVYSIHWSSLCSQEGTVRDPMGTSFIFIASIEILRSSSYLTQCTDEVTKGLEI